MIIIIIKLNKSILERKYLLNKIKRFLNGCLKINSDKIFNNSFKNPGISVIIPVYNCENTIEFAINSIRNQIFKNYEIVLINDFSKDQSKKIIQKLKNNDSRIILINNNKNMGILYSRNIGVLVSKGKYIFPLDNDDAFLDDKIFIRIYKEAEKYNFDVIGFKCIYGNIFNSEKNDIFDDPFIIKKKNMIIYQPALSSLSFINNDCHLWGKSIKNEIYKKAINKLGKKRSSIFLCYAEDDIMIFLIFKLSKTFKFSEIYGLYHKISNKSASNTLPKDHILFSKILFLDVLFDFTENSIKDKEFVIKNAIIYKNFFFSKFHLNEKNKDYLISVINKILKSRFISKKNKIKLKNNFNFIYF